jgi:hypothetical protein
VLQLLGQMEHTFFPVLGKFFEHFETPPALIGNPWQALHHSLSWWPVIQKCLSETMLFVTN